MFCAKCGANVADGAKFCDVCGQPMAAPAAPVAPAAPAYAPAAPVAAPAPKKAGLPVILIAVAAVAVVVLLGVLLLGGSSCEGVVDDYFTLQYEGDLSVVEDQAPEAFWNYVTGEYGMSVEQITENPICVAKAQASATESRNDYNDDYGPDWDFDYTVLCEHDLGQTKLAAVQAKLAEKYGIPMEDIEELVTLHIERERSGDLDEDHDVISRTAVKIDGDWYLLSASFYKNGETGAEVFDGDFVVADLVKTYARALSNQ